MTMPQEITNFARFYAAFRKICYPGDREELKASLVYQATGGRTSSLREVTRTEYHGLCALLERHSPTAAVHGAITAELRRQRSIALHQMQRMGIDTTDWNRVNALCQDRRIAGRAFRRLTSGELEAMTVRLRTIERKGGFGTTGEPRATIISIH